MSVYDPLLRFDTTLSILHDHFASISALPLLYRFHQPPRPFTYEELNGTFYKTVDEFVNMSTAAREGNSIAQSAYQFIEESV
jgi:hypothetical protein